MTRDETGSSLSGAVAEAVPDAAGTTPPGSIPAVKKVPEPLIILAAGALSILLSNRPS